jgi:hypothetical protein
LLYLLQEENARFPVQVFATCPPKLEERSRDRDQADLGPLGAWTMTIYGFLSKAELDTEFVLWRTQMRGGVNGFVPKPGGNG